MAMSDYGWAASKNGKTIKDGRFMNMQNAIGCSMHNMNENWFAFFGDKDLFVSVYKTMLCIVSDGEIILTLNGLNDHGRISTYPNKSCRHIKINNTTIIIKELGTAQFLLNFKYKDNDYKCVYGYGVGIHVYNWWRQIGVKDKSPRKYYKYI